MHDPKTQYPGIFSRFYQKNVLDQKGEQNGERGIDAGGKDPSSTKRTAPKAD
jgi:hypothetical protein